MNNMNKRRQPKGGLYRIAVIALTVVFALNLLILVGRVRSRAFSSYSYEVSSMRWMARHHDYEDLLNAVTNNRVTGGKTSQNTSQFEALADYYQAAVLFHAATLDSDEVRAEKYRNAMDALLPLMTEPEIIECVSDLQSRYGK